VLNVLTSFTEEINIKAIITLDRLLGLPIQIISLKPDGVSGKINLPVCMEIYFRVNYKLLGTDAIGKQDQI
jgi:hypothetical protein